MHSFSTKTTTPETTYARYDTAHCLAPGLFKSIKKGTRDRLKLNLHYQFNETESLQFIGFEPLGVDDLRVLQGLVAMAGPSKATIKLTDPHSSIAQELTLLLHHKTPRPENEACVVDTSISALMREIGYDDNSGHKREQILNSLKRMTNVSIIVKTQQYEWSSNLLSYAINHETNRLMIALNSRISDAVLGYHTYTRFDMEEIRALHSDAARLIHQRLCGWINEGTTEKITLATLVEYVFGTPNPKDPPIAKRTFYQRQTTVRQALQELVELHWTVDEYYLKKFSIARPKYQKS